MPALMQAQPPINPRTQGRREGARRARARGVLVCRGAGGGRATVLAVLTDCICVRLWMVTVQLTSSKPSKLRGSCGGKHRCAICL